MRWRRAASTACASIPRLFTNLTRDHLDYHADMRDYFESQGRAVSRRRPANRIVNLDSEFGDQLADVAGRTLSPCRRTSIALPTAGPCVRSLDLLQRSRDRCRFRQFLGRRPLYAATARATSMWLMPSGVGATAQERCVDDGSLRCHVAGAARRRDACSVSAHGWPRCFC